VEESESSDSSQMAAQYTKNRKTSGHYIMELQLRQYVHYLMLQLLS
jgi:hypothetical protein